MVVVARASAAPAVLPQQTGAVDLLSQANVQIDGAAAVGAACDEPCTLTAAGTITARGWRIRLGPATRTLASAGQTALKLALTGKAVARAKLLLAKRARITARVTVRAKDPSGNVSTATRTVSVRR